jgi:hypothetical protein
VEKHPDVKIELREEHSIDVVRAVFEGSSDIGVFTAGLELPPGSTRISIVRIDWL